jgi:hypothetical protein
MGNELGREMKGGKRRKVFNTDDFGPQRRRASNRVECQRHPKKKEKKGGSRDRDGDACLSIADVEDLGEICEFDPGSWTIGPR